MKKKGLLRERIEKLAREDTVRMHMPGHKGRGEDLALSLDITEIPGADNLHHAEEIIKTVQEKIARIYGAGRSLMLTGGSTAGVIASLMSAARPGEKLLIPANAHRSAFSALALGRIEPVFFSPRTTPYGAYVTEEQIETLLDAHQDVNGALIVSPDYAGCLSETKSIARLLHRRGKKLLVDEAHGAHLHFFNGEDSVAAGADFCVQSVHKTLSAITQSALLHVREEEDANCAAKILSMIESSSPSYLQMISIEESVDEAAVRGGAVFREIFERHEEMLRDQHPRAAFKLVRPSLKYDPSKWLFTVTDGKRACEILKEYGIVPEIERKNQILLMTGIHTTREDLDLLKEAAGAVNRALEDQGEPKEPGCVRYPLPVLKRTIGEAMREKSRRADLREAEGSVSADFVIPYPPGIPVLVPGSEVSREAVEAIEKALQDGTDVIGLENHQIQILGSK